MPVEKALALLYEIKGFAKLEFETVGQKFPEEWEEAINLISKTLSNPGNYFFAKYH